MKRADGITIIALLCFGWALLQVPGVLTFSSQLWLEVTAAKAAGAGTAGIIALLMSLRGLDTVVILVSAVVAVVVGIGLLKLFKWARILTIILATLVLVVSAVSFFTLTLLHHFVILALVSDFVVAGICVWVLWYMFRPQAKQAFGAS